MICLRTVCLQLTAQAGSHSPRAEGLDTWGKCGAAGKGRL